MDFKRTIDKKRIDLQLDRDNIYQSINALISAVIPFKNKLDKYADKEITELYPKQLDGIKAIKTWLATNGVKLKTTLDELKGLLES